MQKKLVSIIMPAYNHEKYIEQCLDSLINQSYQNIELIILNDGSSDNTHQKILENEGKLKRRFVRYRYINKDNEGIAATLNQGLRIANGEYIRFCASDDYTLPDAITKQVNFLDNYPEYGVVYSDGYHVRSQNLDSMSEMYDPKLRFSKIVEYNSGDLYHFFLTSYFGVPSVTFLIRKSSLEHIGPFDETLEAESFDLQLRLSVHYKFGLVNEPLVLHRMHQNNLGWNKESFKKNTLKLINKYSQKELRSKGDNLMLVQKLKKLLNIRGLADYSEIRGVIRNKKLVGWGTGSSYENIQEANCFNYSYLVDKDLIKQGRIIDDLQIKAPEELLNEERKSIFIIIMSQYYKEISEWLEENGFEYMVHYY